MNICLNIIENNNFEKVCINELKEKIKYNILDNNEIKKITNNISNIINILFETEKAIIIIHINYNNNKSNITEFNNFVNSVKEINKLNKNNKKCYALYLSKIEPLQSCKAIFNKENINFEKTSNIKFMTIYNINKETNLSEEYINLLKRLQSKLHSLGIYYYDQDDTIIMA
jgi:hypothetical protein